MTEGTTGGGGMSQPTMAPAQTGRRPGLVTLVAIYLWVVALGDLLQGLARIILQNDADLQASLGLDAGEILIAGLIEAAIGVVIVLVALALMNGSGGARTLVAVAMALRIAATFGVVGLNLSLDETGLGFVLAGILHVLLPIFILWVMYGNEKVDAYFSGS